MAKKILTASILWLGSCLAAQAQIKAEHPRNCVVSVGPAQVMFSAFQENGSDAIFCQHVPAPGQTLIIVDAKQSELRDMNVEVRLLRDTGQADWREDVDQRTIALLPASKHFHNNGTASFRADFTKEGKYIAVVRAFSDDGTKDYVGEYGFSVGETMEFYGVLAAGALALGFIAFGRWGRSVPTLKSASAPSPVSASAQSHSGSKV
jgi:hypothetical protein